MSTSTSAVEVFPPQTGRLKWFADSRWPSELHAWQDGPIELDATGSHFGFVHGGRATLTWGGDEYGLKAGMYFCAPGAASITGGSGFIATRLGFAGLFQIGGPIEPTGRLRYIDGCSDTLLIGPPVLGDPCLNLLHIPPHTRQTSHTHPSERLGMIAAGRGYCRSSDDVLPLKPGDVFAIETDGVHSFNTDADPLLVIAWHPDSDCGPSHNDHPMINRTIVGGVSAAALRGREANAATDFREPSETQL